MNKEIKYIEEEITFKELANRLQIIDLDTPEAYEILDEGYEILSWDEKQNKEIWKPLEAFIVKRNVDEHYQLNTLHGTEKHRILYNGKYIPLKEHPAAELVKQKIQVVDCQVADTHNYIAEGQVNHNTTTPGGMAIPYCASTRIKLYGGKHIEQNGLTIGIEVTAKTIKNKMSRPFRECSFQIMFGKGVVEHEQIFDLLRVYCDASKEGVKCGDKLLRVEGTGAWKTFTITNSKTGEVEKEVKFYKSDFDTKVLDVPEFKEYVDTLMDAALIIRPEDTNHITCVPATADTQELTNS